MATEAAMVSVNSPDSDSESEESYENMEGMFMAERIRVLPCRVGAQLLVSVKYVRNQSSIVEVRVVRVRVESVHAMYTHADQIVRYNHNYERHNHFNLAPPAPWSFRVYGAARDRVPSTVNRILF